MPLYEYYCQPCNGIFEMLRPVREAALPQPCPECDDDAKRIVSKDFNAFIFREGIPRRLPDDGTYQYLWHKVSDPISRSADDPDLKSKPVPTPTVEELEKWEYTLSQRRRRSAENEERVVDIQKYSEERAFTKRLLKVRGPKKVEKEKRRILQTGMQEGRRLREEKERRLAPPEKPNRTYI